MIKGDDYIGVGVGAFIINNNQEVLLLKRLKSPEKCSWTIPGGSVEFGETIEEAVIREVREEVGVEINLFKLLGVTNYIDNNEKYHWVAPIFLAEITKGIPRNIEPNIHEEMDWFLIKKLPNKLTMMTIMAIKEYKKINSAYNNVNYAL